jgi:hypothetical protein
MIKKRAIQICKHNDFMPRNAVNFMLGGDHLFRSCKSFCVCVKAENYKNLVIKDTC